MFRGTRSFVGMRLASFPPWATCGSSIQRCFGAIVNFDLKRPKKAQNEYRVLGTSGGKRATSFIVV